MKKGWMMILMLGILLQSGFAVPEDGTGVFQERGIVVGDSGGDLRLEDEITRAEFLKVLTLQIYDEDYLKREIDFPPYEDVKRTDWHVRYFGLAAKKGWYPEEKRVCPNEKISLAEMLRLCEAIMGKEETNGALRLKIFEKSLQSVLKDNIHPEQNLSRRRAFDLLHRIFEDYGTEDIEKEKPVHKEVLKI